MKNVLRGMRNLAVACALCLLFVPGGTAGAATRNSFPQGFYGVGYSGNVELLSYGAQTKLWNKLAEGGAESVRLLFNWEVTEQKRGTYKWSQIDQLVTRAVTHNMSMLPVVEYAPKWAKQYPNQVASPPKNVADYTKFLRDCILRYGPSGNFWTSHPTLPKRPVREWEVWNEPEISFHWYRGPNKPPWRQSDAQRYVDLLKAAYTTVHTTDPLGGKVVSAALSIDSWKNLKKLYDWTDIEGRFDIAAIQAYSGTTGFIPTLMRNFRNALDAHGALAVPIYVTEMTWPAAKGKAHPRYTTGYMSGFLTDQQGAARRLTDGYRILRNMRSELKLQRVFWYTGVTAYQGNNEFEYSGLLTYKNSQVKTFPVFGAYQKSAAAAEGCAKKSNGTCR